MPGGGFVSYTQIFTYLGSRICYNLRDDQDIDARINKATRNFGAMLEFDRMPQVSAEAKYRIFMATQINLLLWGCECWALRSRCLDKLESASVKIGFKCDIITKDEYHFTCLPTATHVCRFACTSSNVHTFSRLLDRHSCNNVMSCANIIQTQRSRYETFNTYFLSFNIIYPLQSGKRETTTRSNP